MSGVVIVSNQPFAAPMVESILHKYFPSQKEGHLYVKNKYFNADVSVRICNHAQLEEISKEEHKIDCLILITSLTSNEHNLIAKNLKKILEKVDPVSQVLLIDGLEGEDIDLETFYEESDCFIQSLTIDVETETGEAVKELPKSLVEDAEGVLRLAQIIDSTSWRSIKKANKVSQSSKNANPKVQTQVVSESAAGKNTLSNVPPGVNIYTEGVDNKLEKDMNQFSALMDQMLSLKGQSLPDSERKQRAADLIMKLAMSMEGEEDEDDEFNEFSE